METAFTPVASLTGGLLIGVAAVALMWLHGRILGATGILSGVLGPSGGADWSLRAALLAGMLAGPAIVWLATGAMPPVQVPVSTGMLVGGGLLVGIGGGFASGCTSGHGICGMARLSPRSLVATATFMAATFATVFVVRHVAGA